MIQFFKGQHGVVLAVKSAQKLSDENIDSLNWLFGNAKALSKETLSGKYIGPRREMITPWSTTAVEITQNMNITGIERIEEYFPTRSDNPVYDKMLQRLYNGLDQDIFTVNNFLHFSKRYARHF